MPHLANVGQRVITHNPNSNPKQRNDHCTDVQVIMLLLGGFAIAGALSKHFIAKSMATAILSRVGRQPHWVLLANMLVATFLSMFISNVAAPVLCFGLVQPILRTYAAGTSQSCPYTPPPPSLAPAQIVVVLQIRAHASALLEVDAVYPENVLQAKAASFASEFCCLQTWKHGAAAVLLVDAVIYAAAQAAGSQMQS